MELLKRAVDNCLGGIGIAAATVGTTAFLLFATVLNTLDACAKGILTSMIVCVGGLLFAGATVIGRAPSPEELNDLFSKHTVTQRI